MHILRFEFPNINLFFNSLLCRKIFPLCFRITIHMLVISNMFILTVCDPGRGRECVWLSIYWLKENIWLRILKFFLGGTPILAPQSVASQNMTTDALPMTPLFYCRILLHSKNVDVCKKLELNPLRFDRDIRVLSQKKYF